MAYIPTQFQVDEEREQQRLGGVDMLLKGISGLEENRRRALDEGNKQKLLDAQIKESDYKQAQRTLPLEEQDEFKKLTALAKLKAGNKENLTFEQKEQIKAKYRPQSSAQKENLSYQQKLDMQEATKLGGETRKLEADRNKGLQDAAIQDFDVANPNIIPTQKDAEEVKKLNAANKTFSDVGNKAVEIVKTLDWKDRTGFTSKYKDLQQSVTEMRLQAKELANLGVLNGPDLTLVDQTLGSVGVTDLNLYGPEEAAKRISSAIKTANDKLQNAASARGYKSRAPSQVQSKPKTVRQNGQTFILNEQTGEYE